MFLGHAGIALGLQRVEPKASLGTLIFAAYFVDFLFGITVLLGWEQVAIVPGATAVTPLIFDHYPITHSLVGGVIWALVLGAAYYSWPTRDTSRHFRATLVVMGTVVSHFVLDAITHVPDLPLSGPDSLKVGLGLWQNLPGTLVIEFLMLAGGLYLFLTRGRSNRHRAHTGRIALLAVVLIAVYLGSILGPPPASPTNLAWTLLIGVPILTGLAAWAGRDRR